MSDRRVYRFDEIDWHFPNGAGADPSAVEAAAALGVVRKHYAQGAAGFYVQIVRFPPDFETPPHSHDHSEVFVVLDGSCVFDGEPMRVHDSTVVEADDKYGFTAGADGVLLLVVRTGAAAISM
jgi:quercetin dioxygenase-like cupin family protein